LRRALYPGSFDPVTMGHMDIIRRGSSMFDKFVVAVLLNPSKDPLFSIEERVCMLKEACVDLPNVSVDCFRGLLVSYAEQVGASVIVKGLRAVSDFDYELQQAHFNRQFAPNVDTVFLATDAQNSFLSSSLVREVARLGGSVEGLVPAGVVQRLQGKLAPRE